MEMYVISVLAVLIGLVLGVFGSYLVKKIVFGRRYAAAKSAAELLLEDAEEE